MRTRYLDQQEKEATRTLYESAFPSDGKGFVDYYYQEKMRDNRVLILEEEGTVRSMLHLNPYTVSVGGRRYPSEYIVAVATDAAYRHRGYMRRLLERALLDMNREGKPFVYLMPAAEAIYLPFGFRTISSQISCEPVQNGESAVCSRPAGADDAARLAAFDEKYLQPIYDIVTVRDAAYYRRLLAEQQSEGGCIRVFERDSEIVGHVLCDREEGEDGRKCKETYRDPVLMPECGGILRTVEKETPPLIMIRIASLERMAEPVTSDEPVELVIEVDDPIVPDNAGIFRWSLDSGGSVVRACKEQPEWKVKIDELGEFLFGVKTAQEWRSEPVFHKLQAIRPFRSVSIQEIV
ncbi:GNAT family N-acetyltransferase [Lachnospiraceae bacterium ASD3451]|uniref:GNAT family N-acetyltransferase n=1 Tax=Diplocloster agilis TaxID=2850323 RepID=UPI001DD5AA57|nr:GNAT family N-acetyltransferase [Diplocloster agilis]MBU9747077.1 GNAT family N-acetyltransferase [Diplocloster agilis]